MKNRVKQQQGSIASVLLIVFLSLAALGALGFGIWAFNGRQDYKLNSDKKSAQAVEVAKAAQKIELQKEFDEQEKLPNETYKGRLDYGSITFNYPKTWSAYIDETAGSQPLNAYFYPIAVPALQSKTAFALRVELVQTDYAQVLQQFESNIKNGKLKAAAYIPPKMKSVTNVQPGIRLDGAISPEKQGSKVVIKVRDKTLQIYTESNDFISDFNEIVLENLSFVP